jgi:hypothetical protein
MVSAPYTQMYQYCLHEMPSQYTLFEKILYRYSTNAISTMATIFYYKIINNSSVVRYFITIKIINNIVLIVVYYV